MGINMAKKKQQNDTPEQRRRDDIQIVEHDITHCIEGCEDDEGPCKACVAVGEAWERISEHLIESLED
jgi:hypothetical protein